MTKVMFFWPVKGQQKNYNHSWQYYTVTLQSHHVQFVVMLLLAKPHMRRGFCTLVPFHC